MERRFLYIGVDQAQLSRFRELARNDLFDAAPDSSDAVVKLSRSIDLQTPVILLERTGFKQDISTIKALRKASPSLYIILISPPLEKEESVAYLKGGVHNIVSPQVSQEGFDQILGFMELVDTSLEKGAKRKAHAVSLKREMRRTRIPLWKRSFDIAASLGAIIVLSPLMILTVLAIKIENPGPAIYRSKRVGTNYRIFDFLKFRSMYTDADKRLKEFQALNQYAGSEDRVEEQEVKADALPEMIGDDVLISDDFFVDTESFAKNQRQKQENSFVKLENDPRITRVGRIIRKYSIDELPQLFNILKGDMSVIGNRPLPLYEAELLTGDEYIDRFMAPAGLTGLWQVEKRGDAGKMSAEERKQLDNIYAKNYTFGMDMKILLRTFTSFIQKENV